MLTIENELKMMLDQMEIDREMDREALLKERSIIKRGCYRPKSRGARHKDTSRCHRRLSDLNNLTMSVRPVIRKDQEVSYIRKGNTWKGLQYYKRMSNRQDRHDGKAYVRSFSITDYVEVSE